jgi:hypothetical protein
VLGDTTNQFKQSPGRKQVLHRSPLNHEMPRMIPACPRLFVIISTTGQPDRERNQRDQYSEDDH